MSSAARELAEILACSAERAQQLLEETDFNLESAIALGLSGAQIGAPSSPR